MSTNNNHNIENLQLTDEITTQCRYYDPNSFTEQNNTDSGNFFIYHQNIRSFNKNSDEVFLYIDKKLQIAPDVLVFSETWFNLYDITLIEGYSDFHTVRENRRGGGVSIYVKNNYPSKQLKNLSFINEFIEICGVEINLSPQTKVVILGLYRPPNASILEFNIKVNECMNIFSQSTHVYFVGDFNIDLMNPDDLGSDFINTCHLNSYSPLITSPTRITTDSATLIDHIWTNQLYDCFSGILDCLATDHYPVFTKIKINLQLNQTVRKKFRDHSEVNINKLLDEINNGILNTNTDVNDINLETEFFSNKLYELYNKCCPIKEKNISFKRLQKPWITDELLDRINIKHFLFKQMKNNLIPFHVYNDYKNSFSNLLKQTKRNYYLQKFDQCSGDIKMTWKYLNMLIKAKKSKPKIVLTEDDRDIVDDEVVAHKFNNYFSNVATELDDKIPQPIVSPLQFMSEPNQSTFFALPTNAHEVSKVISTFKNKASDLETVPVFIFKTLKDMLSPHIAHLFNKSLNTGVFPDCLKLAKIIPIFKAGDTKLMKNYRPISMLPFLSKLFERLMYSRLVTFLEKYNILSNEQFGFRKNSSTSDAVVEFLDNAYRAMDDKNYLIAVFLDFSKTFDTVNHSILLQKLNHLGIRGSFNKWFSSYLKNRKQYVSINNKCSSKTHITLGVPQGSILGPILFLLYINDMPNSSDRLKFVHFADDTTVFASDKNVNRLIDTLNNELKNVDDWLVTNRLSLNVQKTSYMVFTNLLLPNNINIEIRGSSLSKVSNMKFLGIYIDDKLSFNTHVIKTKNKLAKAVGVMKRMSQVIPKPTMLNLYYTLFYSQLTYGIIAWGKSSIQNHNKINSIQKRSWKSLMLSDPLNELLNFDSVYKYFVAVKTYKAIVNSEHTYFQLKFNSYIPLHNYETRTRHQNNLNVPYFRTSKAQNSFFFQAIHTWNELPIVIRNTNLTLKSYKRKLKEYLIYSQNTRLN